MTSGTQSKAQRRAESQRKAAERRAAELRAKRVRMTFRYGGVVVVIAVIVLIIVLLTGSTPSTPTAKSATDIKTCLLYTSDAADEEDSVDLGGRRIIKK